MSKAQEDKNRGPEGIYICMFISGILYFFEFVESKGVLQALGASIIFGPILGIVIYILGCFAWEVFSDGFQSGTTYAKKKGMPTFFAWIWGALCGLGLLFLIG